MDEPQLHVNTEPPRPDESPGYGATFQGLIMDQLAVPKTAVLRMLGRHSGNDPILETTPYAATSPMNERISAMPMLHSVSNVERFLNYDFDRLRKAVGKKAWKKMAKASAQKSAPQGPLGVHGRRDSMPLRSELKNRLPSARKSSDHTSYLKLGLTLFFIGVVYSVTPICIGLVIYTIVTAPHPLRKYGPYNERLHGGIWIFVAFAGIETAFAIAYRLIALRIQRRLLPPEKSHDFVWKVMQHVFENGLADGISSDEAVAAEGYLDRDHYRIGRTYELLPSSDDEANRPYKVSFTMRREPELASQRKRAGSVSSASQLMRPVSSMYNQITQRFLGEHDVSKDKPPESTAPAESLDANSQGNDQSNDEKFSDVPSSENMAPTAHGTKEGDDHLQPASDAPHVKFEAGGSVSSENDSAPIHVELDRVQREDLVPSTSQYNDSSAFKLASNVASHVASNMSAATTSVQPFLGRVSTRAAAAVESVGSAFPAPAGFPLTNFLHGAHDRPDLAPSPFEAPEDLEKMSAVETHESPRNLHTEQQTIKKSIMWRIILGESLDYDDQRAVDFRSYMRLWFGDVPFSDIHRENLREWLAATMYGIPLSEINEDPSKVKPPTWWDYVVYVLRSIYYFPARLDNPSVQYYQRKRQDHSASIILDDLLVDDEEAEDPKPKVRVNATFKGSRSALLDFVADITCRRAGVPDMPDGRNKKLTSLRLTIDPVRVAQRPLLLYMLVFFGQLVVRWRMKTRGFAFISRGNDLPYLIRVPKGWKARPDLPENERPLLFLHGLGMGIFQYRGLLNFLSRSPENKKRPIIFLIQPHISMMLFTKEFLHPPDEQSLSGSIVSILRFWNFDKCPATVLSHSNGTIVHGWLLRRAPELVERSCFVDPVCFSLWEPYVCYNFLYNRPSTPVEWFMRYFVSRELGIAFMLQRHFDWSSCVFFPSEIPNISDPYRTACFVGSADQILAGPRVYEYLVRSGMAALEEPETDTKLDIESIPSSFGGVHLFWDYGHGEALHHNRRSIQEIRSWLNADQFVDTDF